MKIYKLHHYIEDGEDGEYEWDDYFSTKEKLNDFIKKMKKQYKEEMGWDKFSREMWERSYNTEEIKLDEPER